MCSTRNVSSGPLPITRELFDAGSLLPIGRKANHDTDYELSGSTGTHHPYQADMLISSERPEGILADRRPCIRTASQIARGPSRLAPVCEGMGLAEIDVPARPHRLFDFCLTNPAQSYSKSCRVVHYRQI